MSLHQASKHILNNPPEDDQGSEAIYGFDYQAHCIARLCIDMISNPDVRETICEYHEDVTRVFSNLPPVFCQIKKRESAGTWTFSLIKDALINLFAKVQYKDVGGLVIYGNGRPSKDGECSMDGLITLLDRPLIERNADWEAALKPYEDELTKLLGSKADYDTVCKGLRLLRIDLTMPHPEAVELQNHDLTTKTIQKIWGVNVQTDVVEKVYTALYKQVWQASKKPKQPRSVKQITNQQAREIFRDILWKEKLLTESPQMLLDIHEKLDIGGLKEYVPYALQYRMDARQIKFELDLGANEWQNLRDEIATTWEEFRTTHSDLMGKVLWQDLRQLLTHVGEGWSATHNDLMGPGFAEGLFFDMMAVCEADLATH